MQRQSIKSQTRAEAIRNVVCENQGYLVNYTLAASDLHKSMKSALYKTDDVAAHQKSERLKVGYQDLLIFLNFSLDKVVTRNFVLLREALDGGRGLPDVRLSFMGPTDDVGHQAMVMFRDPAPPEEVSGLVGRVLEIEESGALQCINETREYYLCPDVPKALKAGEFRHGRLKADAAEKCVINNSSSREDQGWVDLWDGGPADSCYKSTLVVPVTFHNSKMLCDIGVDLEVAPVVAEQLAGYGDSILGYVCMDHVMPNYFNHEDDFPVNIGYVMADFLSLYLVIRYQFTKHSTSFKEAARLCSGGAGL